MSYKNIIVGAGPAGIQLAYFFKKESIEYIILEKAPAAGSFFSSYPHTGKLISINKKNTGSDIPDFNLRHDWNSLLSDDPELLFTKYSDDFYPDHADLVKYLNDFATKHELNIQYNTTVQEIYKTPFDHYTVTCDTGTYKCEKLIIATGLSKPALPPITQNTAVKIKHYGEYEKGYFKNPENLQKFKNKSVLFIGNGNSAYELANILTPLCSVIVIHGRSIKPWAMSTHYAGDLRSVYLPFQDTFLLKSRNAVDTLEGTQFFIDQPTPESKYKMYYKCLGKCDKIHNYMKNYEGYDHVIYCTGWAFDASIYNFDIQLIKNNKYPHINYKYESINNKNLYFIGSLMHSHDHKKSSGGFIHGFRYLIPYFVKINYTNSFDISVLAKDTVADHIIEKINKTSALYQMYGQICDIFYISAEDTIQYYNNVTVQFLQSPFLLKTDATLFFMITLEYGKTDITDTTRIGGRVTTIGKESNSVLLHPVLRVFNRDALIDEIHFDEDLLADFSTDTKKYKEKLNRSLKMFF
jgi:hypothetical protein